MELVVNSVAEKEGMLVFHSFFMLDFATHIFIFLMYIR